jgi:FAD/FMN-containing dehydrogenase
MLRLCHAAGQVVVPQGGLTNLVYNTHTTPEEIALSLERMNRVEEIDPLGGTLTVQAGATLLSVQQAAAAAGLFFPLDLPARESAVIGGLVGTNAGGLRVVRYGMMRDIVLGLEVTLADGTTLSMMNKMLKKNVGYDLKQLFIGAEGTLGVVTRVTLRLWPPQPAAATAFLAVERFAQVAELLALAKECLGGQLTSYEVLWNEFYRLTTTPPAPNTPPLPQDSPCYVLVESLGRDQEEEHARMRLRLDAAHSPGLCTDQSPPRTLRSARSCGARARIPRKWAAYHPTFHFDVSLPIPRMGGLPGAGARGPASPPSANQAVDLRPPGRRQPAHRRYGRAPSPKKTTRAWRRSSTSRCWRGRLESRRDGIGLRKKPYLHLSRTPERSG